MTLITHPDSPDSPDSPDNLKWTMWRQTPWAREHTIYIHLLLYHLLYIYIYIFTEIPLPLFSLSHTHTHSVVCIYIKICIYTIHNPHSEHRLTMWSAPISRRKRNYIWNCIHKNLTSFTLWNHRSKRYQGYQGYSLSTCLYIYITFQFQYLLHT